MNREQLKKIAESAQTLAEPLDLEKLVEDGFLEKKGKSYYVKDIDALPQSASSRINSITQTQNGLKVTFSKDTKAAKKVADKLRKFL